MGNAVFSSIAGPSLQIIEEIVQECWQELKDEMMKPYFCELQEFVKEERNSGLVYPDASDVFSAFSMTPFDAVKVVILGQDPYHGPNQAHGLAFSVQKGVKAPPSLKNIFKELKADLGLEAPDHGCLEAWARQGVFLLNAVLTVREKTPLSHQGKGWERFTDQVVHALVRSGRPLVFMLWGKYAQNKLSSVLSGVQDNILVLKAAHPSPYSAHNFLGCGHFSKANAFLKTHGLEPIDFRLTN